MLHLVKCLYIRISLRSNIYKCLCFYSITISHHFDSILSKLCLFIVYLSVEWSIYQKTTDDGSLAASETRFLSEGNPIASKARLVSLVKYFIAPGNHGLKCHLYSNLCIILSVYYYYFGVYFLATRNQSELLAVHYNLLILVLNTVYHS